MRRTRKAKEPLLPADFAGDGEPYSEVIVKVSIRILGRESSVRGSPSTSIRIPRWNRRLSRITSL